MALVCRYGEVECPRCDWHSVKHKLHVDHPETFYCPECHSQLITLRRRNSLAVPNRYADDPSSELYVRPDANCAYREAKLDAIKYQKLVEEGKLKDIDDAKETMAALREYERNQAYFGSIDIPERIEVPVKNQTPAEKEMINSMRTKDDILNEIIAKTPPEIRNKKIGALRDN